LRKYFLWTLAVTFPIFSGRDNDSTIVALHKSIGNAGLRLPAGFSASTLVDSIGRARHILVTPQGVVYVKLDKLINGKGILRLKDTDDDGKADDINSFGNYRGTGITIKDDYLYASSNEEVFRYKLDKNGEVINTDAPERIIKGSINGKLNNTKSIVLDDKGNIYVNIGSPLNSCLCGNIQSQYGYSISLVDPASCSISAIEFAHRIILLILTSKKFYSRQ